MLQKLGAKTTASLRVLATSDLHGALTPYDYARGREQKGQNLAQLATLINQERASAQNSLLFDNGDFLEGSALADHAFAEFQTDPTAPNPIIAAMNVLGYDAVGLGNHEFDFGLPYLKTALSQANFPCLSSNLEVTSDLNPAHRQSIILSRDLITHDGDKTPIRLGVISLLPPPTLDWDAAELAGRVAIAETVATARTKADALSQVGVDLVIILAHTGLGRTLENAGSDLLDANLADVLVLGHKHEFHPNREAAAPIASNWVMPGFGGKALGVIDLDLTHNGTRWQVTNTHAHLKLSSDGVQSEPRVLDLVATAHRATTRKLDEVLTETETPLSAQFALTHPSAALTVIADAMRHGAQARLPAMEDDLPMLAAASPMRLGGGGDPRNFIHIPKGPVRERDLVKLYPYRNMLRVLRVTGRDLRLWIGYSSRIYAQLGAQADTQDLLQPGVFADLSDTIFGLTYAMDLSQPPGPERVHALHFKGNLVTDDQRFLVATHAYRVSGLTDVLPVLEEVPLGPNVPVRDLLRDYLKSKPSLRYEAERVWSLSLPEKAVVTFIGPPPECCDVIPPGIRQLGQNQAGFTEYEWAAE